MPIRAIAYHPAVASAKLRMYSAISSGEETSVGEGIRCPKCGITFAVIFPIQDDLGNNAYRTRLKRLIRDDCKHGKHKAEYLIDDTR
jgi:hypothetical protein